MDNVEVALCAMMAFGAVGIIVLSGKRGLVGIGIVLALLMASGTFPPHHQNNYAVDGEPLTQADRARAQDVPVDDDLPLCSEVGTSKTRQCVVRYGSVTVCAPHKKERKNSSRRRDD